MRNIHKYILIYLLQFLLANTYAQITPQEIVKKMGRGINLGNTLSAPYEGNWAPKVKESYFEDISMAGFKTVRIPIRFDKHTTPFSAVDFTDTNGNYIGSIADYNVDSLFLDRIEEVISWALEKGLFAIIDIHGDKWFWESYKPNSEFYKTGADRKAAEDRFKAIWRDISYRFKGYSDKLLFEIMNEPYFAMNAEQVHNTNIAILQIIRKDNPARIVIVTGGGKNSWETPGTIKKELLKSDSFLIATFHYYKPNHFTKSSRQGFDDYEWGSQSDKSEVDTHFESVAHWSKENNIPMLLGEFGADNEGGYNYYKKEYGKYGGPTKISREKYHRYIANKAIDLGFCFTVWDAGEKSSKTIYLATSRSWVENVKYAVLDKTISTKDNGIVELEGISIFPNPFVDIVHISSPAKIEMIILYDINGTQIERQLTVNNKNDVFLNGIPPGFYYIAVFLNNNSKKIFKIIKTNES